MDYGVIYNPGIGTEENVQDQVVFGYGPYSIQQHVDHIGIAQGLAELAHSFDGVPVRWVRTTNRLILVVKLEDDHVSDSVETQGLSITDDSRDAWHSGYWFTCGLKCAEHTCPVALEIVVKSAYRQWRLHNGLIQSYISKDRGILSLWWTAFFSNWVGPGCWGASEMYPYINMAPGTLSPSFISTIENARAEEGACELLITTDPASYVWPGNQIGLEYRIDFQKWLFACGGNPEALNEHFGYVNHLHYARTPATVESDFKESEQDISEPQRDIETELESNVYYSDCGETDFDNLGEALETMPEAASFLSGITKAPWMSLDGFGSSLSKWYPKNVLGKMAMPGIQEWFSSRADPVEEEKASFICTGHKSVLVPFPCWVLVYQRKPFTYSVLYRHSDFEKCPEPSRKLKQSLDLLADQLEGFSFALDPPTRFSHLAIDHELKSITSTLPLITSDSPRDVELLHYAIINQKDRQQEDAGVLNCVARTRGGWWIYRLSLKTGAEVVFCKKWLVPDASTLLGALRKETNAWIENHVRRYPQR